MMVSRIAFVAACLLSAATRAETTIRRGTRTLKYSETRPGNILPQFLFLEGEEEGGSGEVKLGGGRGTLPPLRFGG